ncbi:MAG: hypothetical protein C5B59_17235 [Bacteroidetes bacterium]|nr:MAG: hypothetical protein C5B59_17235 [Bacteroidota bacterium]
MGRELDRKTIELVEWYHYNKDRIPPAELKKRCDFYEKTIDIILERLIIICEDFRKAENRPASSHLYLPNGMLVNGDLKKFG